MTAEVPLPHLGWQQAFEEKKKEMLPMNCRDCEHREVKMQGWPEDQETLDEWGEKGEGYYLACTATGFWKRVVTFWNWKDDEPAPRIAPPEWCPLTRGEESRK